MGWREPTKFDRLKISGLSKSGASIDDGAPIINKTVRNPLLFLRYFPPELSSLSHTRHSHSIILSDRNALNSVHKFFLPTMKNRLPDPSEICALEFKGEFRRFKICSVSATIGIDWSIFDVL
jgi:hypothetical protein